MLEHDITIGTELEFEIPKRNGFNKHNAHIYLASKSLENKRHHVATCLGKFKYDGTIKFGFEYASVPLKSSDFLNEKQKDFRKIFKFFDKNKVYVDNHLGMHVHVSKTNLSKEDILKLNYFVFRNPNFCKFIGERNLNKYCRLEENEIEVLGINYNPKLPNDSRYNSNVDSKLNHKHRMLNVARPKTIEFRFFKSTKNVENFIKNIEFVIALVNFVKSSKLTTDDFSIGGEIIDILRDSRGNISDKSEGTNTITNSFCDYIKENKNTYSCLYRFLLQKKLIKKGK